MSNLALAVVLWIVTVICIVGLVVAIKKKQKGLRNFFGIATLGLGFLAFGFSYDAISEIKIEASNKAYEKEKLKELNDSINALTATDKTRYTNIKSIIKDHSKDTQPLICDPNVSNNNYSAVTEKMKKDIKEFLNIQPIDTKELPLIDSVLYLNCGLDTVSFNQIAVLGYEYGGTTRGYIGTNESYIDTLLQLTPQQLNRESQWFAERKERLSENILRPIDFIGKFRETMCNYRYLAMVHLEYSLKPKLGNMEKPYKTTFEGGYGCSRVDVYNLDTGELKESFRVYFTNDNELTHLYNMEKGPGDYKEFLWNNLMKSMRSSVILKLAERGYTHHAKENR